MNQRPRWGPPGGQGMPQGNFSPRPPPQHMQRFPGPSPHNRFGSPRGPAPRQGGFMPRGGGPQRFNGPRPAGNMAPGNITHERPRHQMQNHSPQLSQNFGPGRFQGPPVRGPHDGRALFPSPDSYGRFQPPEFGIPNCPPPRQNFSPRSDMMRPGMMRGPSPMNHQPRNRFNSPHNGNNQGPKQVKKAKIDKRDLPENNQYFCDICDKGFKLEEKYKEHVDSHQKCKYEGCNYVAAPKLVQLHVNLQHKSGLAKKIWSLESAEDIKKWREERKKNFPTVENIEKKKAVDAERAARGEVIEEKYFGKIRQRGKGRFERGRGRGRGQGQERSSPEVAKETKRGLEGSVDTDVSQAKKPKLEGTEAQSDDKAKVVDPDADPLAFFYNAIGSDFDTDSEEEGVTKDKPMEISSREITAAGALGSLISSYGDEAGESDDGNAEDKDNKEQKGKTVDGDSKPKYDKTKRRNRNRGRKNKNEKDKAQQPKTDNKSLLEKLLAKEIRKERNEILQCVYHIVQHNFFEEKRKVTKGTKCNTNDRSSTVADSAIVTKSSEADADSVDAENNYSDNMVVNGQSETSCR